MTIKKDPAAVALGRRGGKAGRGAAKVRVIPKRIRQNAARKGWKTRRNSIQK